MRAWKVSKIYWLISEMFPDSLKCVQMACKVSRWSGKFPDGLDRFQIFWTVSRWPGQFLDGIESFQMAWKVSRWPGKFPDGLKSFQMVWKLSMFIKLSRFTKTFQVALLPCYPGFSASAIPFQSHLYCRHCLHGNINMIRHCHQ